MNLMIARSGKQTFATAVEVKHALGSLSLADHLRLKKIAQARVYGLAPSEWRDLLQEALVRTLSGTRRWSKDVPFIAFVAETMRSIASEWRARAKTHDAHLTRDLEDASNVASDQPDPERTTVAGQLASRIQSAFQGDKAVMALLSGIAAGETAIETQARTKLSHAEYDAARKRFRRWLSRALSHKEEPHDAA